MNQVSHTQSANDLVGDINANLQEMSSQVEVAVTDSAESLVGKLNTAFANVDGKVVLSKDMDAETFVGNLNTNFEASEHSGGEEEPVTEQYDSTVFDGEMTSTLNDIRSLKKEDSLLMLMSTDLHKEDDYVPVFTKCLIPNQKEFIRRANTTGIGVDAVVCLGDFTNGMRSDKNQLISFVQPMVESFKSMGKTLLFAIGNHDTNRDSNRGEILTFKEQCDLYLNDVVSYTSRNIQQDSWDDNKESFVDYSMDFDEKKIRVIVLGCYERISSVGGRWGFSTATINYLESQLDDMVKNKSGYKAVILCHIHTHSLVQSSMNTPAVNKFVELVGSTYKNHILIYIAGHSHVDNVYAGCYINYYHNELVHFPMISALIGCNKSEDTSGGADVQENNIFGWYKYHRGSWVGGAAAKSPSTANCDLWDAVLVTPSESRVDMIRFGAGVNRHIHLTEIECAPEESVVLTPQIATSDNGEWCIKPEPVKDMTTYTLTGAHRDATVLNGNVTVNAGITAGTRICVYYKTEAAREYWSIKVI